MFVHSYHLMDQTIKQYFCAMWLEANPYWIVDADADINIGVFKKKSDL